MKHPIRHLRMIITPSCFDCVHHKKLITGDFCTCEKYLERKRRLTMNNCQCAPVEEVRGTRFCKYEPDLRFWKKYGYDSIEEFCQMINGDQKPKEIVKCKECLHFDDTPGKEFCTLLDFGHSLNMEEGFCAWGERK